MKTFSVYRFGLQGKLIYKCFITCIMILIVSLSFAQESLYHEDDIISWASKLYIKDTILTKSAINNFKCLSFEATSLENALKTLSEDSPIRKQIFEMEQAVAVNLEKTYGLSDFRSQNGSAESFSFNVKYTLSDTQNSPPTQDSDEDGHPDYVEQIAAVLEYSKRQFDNFGFKSVGSSINVEIKNIEYLGYTSPSGPIVLDNSLSLTERRLTTAHELFHKVQYEYNTGWFTNTDWIYEGTAKLSEDIIFDNINNVAWYNQKLRRLDRTLAPTETDQGYEAVLFFKYFAEQCGNPNYSATLIPYFTQTGYTVDPRGADALRTLWEYLDWAPITGNWVSQVDDAIKNLKSGMSFTPFFADWCIANYAKDFSPSSSKYRYLENSLYNAPSLLQAPIALRDGQFSVANQTVNPWSAHYREFIFPAGTQKIRVNITAAIGSGSIEDGGKFFAYLPGSSSTESEIGTWSSYANDLFFDQELNSTGAQKVCIGIAGFRNGLSYNYTVSMVPLITYPTSSAITLNAGSSYNISWNGFSGTNVKIELYKGTTLNTTISASTQNDGSYSWPMPTGQTAGTDYKIRITSLTNVSEVDNSDNNFTIIAPTLNPPRNLTATAGNTQATLNWSAPSSGTPSGYKAYYSTSENGSYTALPNTVTGLSTTVTGMSNGTTYWFYVTAVYSGSESGASNKVSAVPSGGSTTETTLTVNTTATNASISTSNEVDWYKFQTGTAGTYTIQTYGGTDVYMYLYSSNKTSLLTEDDDGAGSGGNSKISRSLSANTWYYVKISGYNSSITGSYSIDVKGGGTTTLNPPRNLTATAGNTQATLNWSAPSSGTPSGYKAYYSTSENGSYTALPNTVTGLSTTVTGMSNGTTYWFYVTAVYSGSESGASNKVSVVPQGTTSLNPPRNLISSPRNGGAVLSWSAPSSGTPSGYKVYWSNSQNGTYTALTNSYTTTTATLYGMPNGTTYWFYVTAFYSSGESVASNKVSVVPTASSGKPQGEIATNVHDNISLNDNLKVYPNPTTGIITIEGLPDSEKAEIALYNMNSKLVKEQTSHSSLTQMDISDLVPGVYLLVTNNRFEQAVKIIKK